MKWATREKEIKANEKAEKRHANTKGEAGAKKRQKEIDLGNWKIIVKQKGSAYVICY